MKHQAQPLSEYPIPNQDWDQLFSKEQKIQARV
jgi:hypothetical protein